MHLFLVFVSIIIISGRMDTASATETINTVLISNRIKPKTIKIAVQLPCLMFRIMRDSVKPPPCVVDRLVLARRLKVFFAVL